MDSRVVLRGCESRLACRCGILNLDQTAQGESSTLPSNAVGGGLVVIGTSTLVTPPLKGIAIGTLTLLLFSFIKDN